MSGSYICYVLLPTKWYTICQHTICSEPATFNGQDITLLNERKSIYFQFFVLSLHFHNSVYRFYSYRPAVPCAQRTRTLFLYSYIRSSFMDMDMVLAGPTSKAIFLFGHLFYVFLHFSLSHSVPLFSFYDGPGYRVSLTHTHHITHTHTQRRARAYLQHMPWWKSETKRRQNVCPCSNIFVQFLSSFCLTHTHAHHSTRNLTGTYQVGGRWYKKI